MKKHAFTLLISAVVLTAGLVLAPSVFTADKPLEVICDIWPPYQIQEGEVVNGLAATMVRDVFDRMEVEIEELDGYPWKRALAILENGHADALFSANFTKDRKTFARYPDEVLFDSPWVIWTRGAQDIKSLDDLRGKSVGVVIGYSYTPEFWEFIETYCKVEKVSTDKINFKKLAIGRLDATVAEYGNATYLTRKLGLRGITPHRDIVIKNDGLYIMFNKDRIDADFVQRFSDELRDYKKTEAYKAVRREYLGE